MGKYESSREKGRKEERAKEGFKNRYGSSESACLRNQRIKERHDYYKNR